MRKALALPPEIILHIGDHIREKDLLSSCNARSLQFQFAYPTPFLKLHSYTRLSHLRIDVNPVYLSIYDNDSANMPRALLRGLIPELLHSTAEGPPKHVFGYLRTLVTHNAAIVTCLTLTCDIDLSTGLFWRAVGSCPQLVRVEFFMVMIQARTLMSFLHACANIKHLTMLHTTINIEGAMPEIERDMPTFARLEELIWMPVFGQFEERLLVMLDMRRCSSRSPGGRKSHDRRMTHWPRGSVMS
ncbi:hypothetical protein BG005_001403 [Podila minutissima]|nr:hypothetical protein BG005_001403 [Podila minutissima]